MLLRKTELINSWGAQKKAIIIIIICWNLVSKAIEIMKVIIVIAKLLLKDNFPLIWMLLIVIIMLDKLFFVLKKKEKILFVLEK